MNIELLLKVKERILESPNLFDMRGFAIEKSCGTSYCIAGWALKEAGLDVWENKAIYRACNALEITFDSGWGLFYEDGWPDDLLDEFESAKSDEARATVAAKVIDRFIEEPWENRP